MSCVAEVCGGAPVLGGHVSTSGAGHGAYESGNCRVLLLPPPIPNPLNRLPLVSVSPRILVVACSHALFLWDTPSLTLALCWAPVCWRRHFQSNPLSLDASGNFLQSTGLRSHCDAVVF